MVPPSHWHGLIGLEVQQDLGPADWVPPLLRRWGQDAWPPRVDSLVPPVFESYARILSFADGRPLPAAALLVRPLLLHTSTAGCWFGIWNGYGDVDADAPTFETCHRRYWLFRGPIHAPASMSRPPDLWWPEDRAWFVAGDTDQPYVYLGGTRACLSLVLHELTGAESVEPDASIAAES